MINPDEIKYLVFDIESVPDAELIRKVKYPGAEIDDVAAVRKFQEEILSRAGEQPTSSPSPSSTRCRSASPR